MANVAHIATTLKSGPLANAHHLVGVRKLERRMSCCFPLSEACYNNYMYDRGIILGHPRFLTDGGFSTTSILHKKWLELFKTIRFVRRAWESHQAGFIFVFYRYRFLRSVWNPLIKRLGNLLGIPIKGRVVTPPLPPDPCPLQK